jgi:cystathionine beta-synthase
MTHTNGILQLIGNTPMVEITHFDTGLCKLFVKLESQNPSGSVKDRIALSMIEAAEREGKLKPGGTIVEATGGGNTGLGLALVAAIKGYKTILTMPDKVSREKAAHCKALGADVRITRSDVPRGHPDHFETMAIRIAQQTGGYYINQFGNPANPEAHEKTTGPEIWAQMHHQVDAIVFGAGSGGTLTGVGRYFEQVSPQTDIILADPVGPIFAPYVERGETVTAGSWMIEGIGMGFMPSIIDLKRVKKVYSITDAEAFQATRDLVMKEAIFAGTSSGALVAAALKYCQEQTTPKRVATFICDTGGKYLSKVFSDIWMLEQGFAPRHKTGTVEDLIVRFHDRGDAAIARPNDNLLTAYKRMRSADVSQLPVLDDHDHVIGMIAEEAIFAHANAAHDKKPFTHPVKIVMNPATVQLAKNVSLHETALLLQENPVLLVTEGGRFIGLVTRIDLLNHFILHEQ